MNTIKIADRDDGGCVASCASSMDVITFIKPNLACLLASGPTVQFYRYGPSNLPL